MGLEIQSDKKSHPFIFADYNATAPLHPKVKEYIIQRISHKHFANPNSLHRLGKEINLAIEKSREICADVLDCQPEQIIFNSGSSESIAHIMHSLLKLNPNKNKIIAPPFEHASVDSGLKYYETQGKTLININVNTDGTIDLNHLKTLIIKHQNDISFVCAMAVNNETGVIQPYEEIQEICNSFNIHYLCDTTQLIGKKSFSFKKSTLDFAFLSGHKVQALPGTGIMIVKDKSVLSPFIFGGKQEFSLRGGTQNYIGIESLCYALTFMEEELGLYEKNQVHKKQFEQSLKEKFDNLIIPGKDAPRISSTTMLGIEGLHSQVVQIELEAKNIYVTTSSACSENFPKFSPTLKSMGLSESLARSVIRIGLGPVENASDIYSEIEKALVYIYSKLLSLNYSI